MFTCVLIFVIKLFIGIEFIFGDCNCAFGIIMLLFLEKIVAESWCPRDHCVGFRNLGVVLLCLCKRIVFSLLKMT